MAIEKSVYTAPTGEMGIAGFLNGTEQFEEEMPATETELEDGSVEITFEEQADPDTDPTEGQPFDANLVEFLDKNTVNTLAEDIMELVDQDIMNRQEWIDMFIEGLNHLGMKYEQVSEPWQNACGAYSTVLSESAMRFQAEAMGETFPAAGPVKTKILGDSTREKEDAAVRVKADMNYELTERMPEYRGEHERMLYSLGLQGSAFKKVYYDDIKGRQVALYLPAEDVIVPWETSDLSCAERVTQVMRKSPNEMIKLQASGFYTDTVTLTDPVTYQSDLDAKKSEDAGHSVINDNRHTLYEIHIELIIPNVDKGDGEVQLPKPYIVTIEKDSNEVLAIRRNWKEGDQRTYKRNYFVHYVYVPGFGFYGLGLIHIVGGYARAGTSILRQLVDAGTLSNLPGGLKTRGMRIKGEDEPVAPGEWRDVDVPSGSLKDNLMPMPYKEPSATLFSLLEKLTDEGRRLGAIPDLKVSDMSANAPVGTTLALLEQSLKPIAAVQARVHYAMKTEFKLIKDLILEYGSDTYEYTPQNAPATVRKQDYAMVDLIPVSDPNSTTMAQRVVQFQTVIEMAKGVPQIYDMQFLHKQMIQVMGIPNVDKIIPGGAETPPADPVSENMNCMVGKPVKAFIYQDHKSHIAAHASLLQDPIIAAGIGQNPMAQQIMASLHAHIMEHMAFDYRMQIEAKLGAPLPAPNEAIPEEIEVLLSQVIAEAATQLQQQHMQEAAQQKAQQEAQDPLMQMQREEVEIKKGELKRKEKKDADDKEIELLKLGQQGKKVVADATVKDVLSKRQTQVQLEQQRQQATLAREQQQNQSKQAVKAKKMDIVGEHLKPKPDPKPAAKPKK
jgi:hypothetical protein